jgi:hypothetical protein
VSAGASSEHNAQVTSSMKRESQDGRISGETSCDSFYYARPSVRGGTPAGDALVRLCGGSGRAARLNFPSFVPDGGWCKLMTKRLLMGEHSPAQLAGLLMPDTSMSELVRLHSLNGKARTRPTILDALKADDPTTAL